MGEQIQSSLLQSPLALVLVVLALMLALYLSRKSVYTTIKTLANLIAGNLRLQSKALMRMSDLMRARNRDVLLEMGMSQKERELEREFYRVNAIVDRDLSGYPELQRKISEHITAIEEDYQKTGETPPPSPDWVEAVEAVSNLKEAHKGNPVIGKMLGDLHDSVVDQHKKSLGDYREAIAQRHRLLHVMMPHWRKLNNAVSSVGVSIKGLLSHAQAIDHHMDSYEKIRSGDIAAERMLKSSATNHFLFSLLILIIAVAGAYVNYQLIALPMSEMVGGSSQRFVGGMSVSEFAAAFIVLLEMFIGLFLMEFLHITRLIPMISSLDDKIRGRFVVALFALLILLAGAESGLAYMRDQIAAADEALKYSLIEGELPAAAQSGINQSIPLGVAMMLGFMLPFALMFMAIPVEMLFNTARIVLSGIVVNILHFFAIILRLIANLIKHTGELLISIYNILIFIPLWLEGLVLSQIGSKNRPEVQDEIVEEPLALESAESIENTEVAAVEKGV